MATIAGGVADEPGRSPGVFLGGAVAGDRRAAARRSWWSLAVVRAAGLWLLEVLAQRAAGRLQGRLRADLVDRTFRLGPGVGGGAPGGRPRRASYGGPRRGRRVDGARTSRRGSSRARCRCSSSLVVVLIDPLSSLVLIFTGPVLLLLLAVIGSRTQAISDRRFAELRWLSAFFVELLRGLPTLRAFGRSREQAGRCARSATGCGMTTMDVLRSAFQTGLVLDWGGAVAMALVAVQVGLRLMADAIPFDRALAVLFITPEFFLPLRQLAVRYHAGLRGPDGRDRGVRDPRRAGAGRAVRRPSPSRRPAAVAAPSRPSHPLRRRHRRATPGAATPALDALTLDDPGRRPASRSSGRPGPARRRSRGCCCGSSSRTRASILVGGTPLAALDAGGVARPGRAGSRRRRTCSTARSPTTCGSRGRTPRDAQLRDALEAAAGARARRRAARRHRHRRSARAACASAAASGSGSRSPARSCATRRSSSSTSRPRTSIRRWRRPSRRRCAGLAGTRTVIVISHRLRLAEDADLVAVLHEGRLVEAGPARRAARRRRRVRRAPRTPRPEDPRHEALDARPAPRPAVRARRLAGARGAARLPGRSARTSR